MTRYFYEVYTINQTPFNIQSDWITHTSDLDLAQVQGYKNYAFYENDTYPFKYSSPVLVTYDSRLASIIYSSKNPLSGVGYNNRVFRMTVRGFIHNDNKYVRCDVDYKISTVDHYDYSRGNYIEVIIAEEGTYPDDGMQGGYWYIKTTLAFPELNIKVDGQLMVSEKGWVKVDGQLREIQNMWVKANGALREV